MGCLRILCQRQLVMWHSRLTASSIAALPLPACTAQLHHINLPPHHPATPTLPHLQAKAEKRLRDFQEKYRDILSKRRLQVGE